MAHSEFERMSIKSRARTFQKTAWAILILYACHLFIPLSFAAFSDYRLRKSFIVIRRSIVT